MNKIIFFPILLVTILAITPVAFARIGVGVNLGKIEIDEPLRPGGIYNFPSIGVINTGDEPAEYQLDVTYHQDQPQLRPAKEWFSFGPARFHLEPGQSQNVAVRLSLPIRGVKPGDYFAYLEARPIIEMEKGVTTIGVAAATKAYFSVIPANIWQAIYYKTQSFLTMYASWTYIVVAMLVTAIIIAIVKKYFAFQVVIRKK